MDNLLAETAFILFCFLLVASMALLSVWAIKDARRRGKRPFWVWLLVFLSFPLGLIVWFALRPAPQKIEST